MNQSAKSTQLDQLPEITPEQAMQALLNNQALLDVRAPVEYAQGSFPNSRNLPLLNDEERHRVGICYKQQGNAAATALGHELIQGKRKADLLRDWTNYLDQHPESLLYCFRGGQRSHIAQQWLAEAGYRVPLIQGGYKALRRLLCEALESQLQSTTAVVIGGRTGVRKTTLIEQLPTGIDLERLANHRGSAFGRKPTPQPATIDFEHTLIVDLLRKTRAQDRPNQPIYFEDESRNIGSVAIPLVLRQHLQQAPVYVIEDSLMNRTEELARAYVYEPLRQHEQVFGESEGRHQHADYLRKSLARIQKRLGFARYDCIREKLDKALQSTHAIHQPSVDASAHHHWIRTLLVEYYDPMYDYQLKQKAANITFAGSWDAVYAKATQNQLANS